MSQPSFCRKCGTPLKASSQFCPRCGKSVTVVMPPIQQTYGPQPQVLSQSSSSWSSGDKIWGIDKRILLLGLIILVLVLPIFPREKVIYVSGQTQTVSQSTSYATSFQTYTTNTPITIKVYKGSLQYVSDQYYNYYQQYYQYCYWDQYGNYICYYQQWPYYQQYVGSVIIDPSDEVIKMEQTNEPGGLVTITLTHYDGTQDSYRHVVFTDLTKSATATVQGTATITNTITNSNVSPVTSTIPCQNCQAQTVTEHVSILQMLFGF